MDDRQQQGYERAARRLSGAQRPRHWGWDNVFTRNVLDVRSTGYGFAMQNKNAANHVSCNNTVLNAASGFANVPCE